MPTHRSKPPKIDTRNAGHAARVAVVDVTLAGSTTYGDAEAVSTASARVKRGRKAREEEGVVDGGTTSDASPSTQSMSKKTKPHKRRQGISTDTLPDSTTVDDITSDILGTPIPITLFHGRPPRAPQRSRSATGTPVRGSTREDSTGKVDSGYPADSPGVGDAMVTEGKKERGKRRARSVSVPRVKRSEADGDGRVRKRRGSDGVSLAASETVLADDEGAKTLTTAGAGDDETLVQSKKKREGRRGRSRSGSRHDLSDDVNTPQKEDDDPTVKSEKKREGRRGRSRSGSRHNLSDDVNNTQKGDDDPTVSPKSLRPRSRSRGRKPPPSTPPTAPHTLPTRSRSRSRLTQPTKKP
ncbi:hypothetical protein HK104_003130, partial [Borealophlyctis nickersoniae]